MSTYESNDTVSMPAGEDLTGDLHKLVQLNSSSQIILATAATQTVIGVVGEEVDTVGAVTSMTLLKGIVMMKAAEAIPIGDLVVAGASGLAYDGGANVGALAADEFAVGVALDLGAANKVIRVLAMPISSSTET